MNKSALEAFKAATKPECTCTNIIHGAGNAAENFPEGKMPEQADLDEFKRLQHDCLGAVALSACGEEVAPQSGEVIKKGCKNPIGTQELLARCGRIGLGEIEQ